MPQTAKQIARSRALNATREAEARLWGMKHRAAEKPPTAAKGGFPYPARTCAEWELVGDRVRGVARKGAAMLEAAIARMAA